MILEYYSRKIYLIKDKENIQIKYIKLNSNYQMEID